MRLTLSLLMLLCGCLLWPRAVVGADALVRFELPGRQIDGMLLAQSTARTFVLGRDGRLWNVASNEVKNLGQTSPSFRGLSASELRGQLLAEFGRSYDVSGTGHFLVVHPAGQRDLWAPRFEQLYRSFRLYFTSRGFALRESPYPLVAVVFPRRDEFLQYSRAAGHNLGSEVLGYYSPHSNRIVMYDQTAGNSDDRQWHRNAAAIIHEATHQTAFNLGIHNRFAEQPRWLVEGLGVMFEAPGVWDSRAHPLQRQRLHFGQLTEFKKYAAAGRPTDSLAQLISSDRSFQTNPRAAYAESWALSFYLAENHPRAYFDYLTKVGSRPIFQPYPAAERVQDFVAAFGGDWAMLDARLLRFIDGLE